MSYQFDIFSGENYICLSRNVREWSTFNDSYFLFLQNELFHIRLTEQLIGLIDTNRCMNKVSNYLESKQIYVTCEPNDKGINYCEGPSRNSSLSELLARLNSSINTYPSRWFIVKKLCVIPEHQTFIFEILHVLPSFVVY